ncbi:hypothetical protein PYH37_002814 [Sinorhizobium numidicum]|uniref:Transposase n=1 Tax=Sinorhizobium numidicum TaxID=680248 RepID=A0ABY8D168_9HYPH|nr:hypothetical protein [Sinorhizobium numidicum]WEX77970.1 hypothetical protein PYH37_002814 [Sinorhizobium numidicum]WEX84629.1 hypothetical protein PYH38_003527 [Sinorhizobium numidicum]
MPISGSHFHAHSVVEDFHHLYVDRVKQELNLLAAPVQGFVADAGRRIQRSAEGLSRGTESGPNRLCLVGERREKSRPLIIAKPSVV